MAKQTKRTPFSTTFWITNSMEIFERMAWYGFWAVSSLYLTAPIIEGGLGFTSEQRGTIQGIVPFILYLLPVLFGALGDRYGYRKTLIIAYSVMTPAYFLLGQVHSFIGFFMIFLLVAIGAAMFKPIITGTIARVTDDTNSSMGFGIFYQMVNIGGFIGPIVAGIVRAMAWKYVFVASSIWISLNFIFVIFLYKEPTKEAGSGTGRSLSKVLADSILVLRNWRFVLFLIILSGFWTVFNQIFLTTPEYIRDFVNTQDVLRSVAAFCGTVGLSGLAETLRQHVANGAQVNPEYIINIDAFSIILFQVFISWFIARFKPFSSLIAGTLITSLGFAATAYISNGWPLIISIFFIAIGEMTASPKSQEYTGKIAPEDQKALYMGYYFVCIALGNLFGGILSGQFYGHFARDMQRPDIMWLLFGALGLITAVGLFLYNQFILKPSMKTDDK
ncbi:MFS transporter [candidate division KSB1 bacterium]|nr:MFS transporter [candidate division KSB1 bacterium]